MTRERAIIKAAREAAANQSRACPGPLRRKPLAVPPPSREAAHAYKGAVARRSVGDARSRARPARKRRMRRRVCPGRVGPGPAATCRGVAGGNGCGGACGRAAAPRHPRGLPVSPFPAHRRASRSLPRWHPPPCQGPLPQRASLRRRGKQRDRAPAERRPGPSAPQQGTALLFGSRPCSWVN